MVISIMQKVVMCAGGGDARRAAVGGRARLGVRLAVRAVVRRGQRGAAAALLHCGAGVAVDALRPAARAHARRRHHARARPLPPAA